MREIKFRAYCLVEEKIYPVTQIDWKNKLITVDEGDNTITDTFDMFILMQSIGKLDKNGIEIYEGDKVSDGKLIYVVEYNTQNTKYCINPIRRITKEEIDVVDFLSYDQLGNGYYSRKDLEVIGNIHETK